MMQTFLDSSGSVDSVDNLVPNVEFHLFYSEPTSPSRCGGIDENPRLSVHGLYHCVLSRCVIQSQRNRRAFDGFEQVYKQLFEQVTAIEKCCPGNNIILHHCHSILNGTLNDRFS